MRSRAPGRAKCPERTTLAPAEMELLTNADGDLHRFLGLDTIRA